MEGRADDVDLSRKMVTVKESVVDSAQGLAVVEAPYDYESAGEARPERRLKKREGKRWEVAYDKLVVSVGSCSQTFGTKGIKEHAFFMKNISDAKKVRKRVLECFEIAALPTTSDQFRRQLLNFAVVGGGPTGMEFAAELSDLVSEDMTRLYPTLAPKVRITVYDVAPRILSMFDQKLREYAMQTFKRKGVDVRTSQDIQQLRSGLPRIGAGENADEVADSQGCCILTTKEDGDVGIGMCVWSTGNMMNTFVQGLLKKSHGFPSASAEVIDNTGQIAENVEWMIEKNKKTGAIVVDDHLRVQLQAGGQQAEGDKDSSEPSFRALMTDVFALGDNASIRDYPLPATAQTASQQALWLGKHLNNDSTALEAFRFKNLGIMAYVGSSKGLLQTGNGKGVQGYLAWLIWRGAYLTKSVSWRNKMLIPTYWWVALMQRASSADDEKQVSELGLWERYHKILNGQCLPITFLPLDSTTHRPYR